MADTPQEVIELVLENPVGADKATWLPDEILDALRENGYEVVRIPSQAEGGNFPTQEIEDPLVWKVRATQAGSTPLVSYGEKLMPPWYARRLAASLLAAAVAAERVVGDKDE